MLIEFQIVVEICFSTGGTMNPERPETRGPMVGLYPINQLSAHRGGDP